MTDLRTVDALCPSCQDVLPHVITLEDPGSCRCTSCGTDQQLMVPVGSP